MDHDDRPYSGLSGHRTGRRKHTNRPCRIAGRDSLQLGDASDAGRKTDPWRRLDQRGQVAVETVLLVPAIILVLAMVTAGWRIWWARSQVQEAAASAARAASLERSGGAAQLAARVVVEADLATVGAQCRNPIVAVDGRDFVRPPGTDGQIDVHVTCQLLLSDLLVPGLPGSVGIYATATERLDTFRERRP